jgi:hypothetical protein
VTCTNLEIQVQPAPSYIGHCQSANGPKHRGLSIRSSLLPKVSVGSQLVLALALETRQKHSVGLRSISVAQSLHVLWK